MSAPIRALTLLLPLLLPGVAAASLADVFRDPRLARLGLAPLAPAFASTVASTYPIASASSSFAYRYNPAVDALERQERVLGPILGERAETLGQGRFDFGVSYSFVELETINGESLDDLVNVPVLRGRFLYFPVPGGVRLRDGRFVTLLPVQVHVDMDVTAHIATPSLTYGLTPDLDVNVGLPLLRTALNIDARTRVPDPRIQAYALPPGDPTGGIDFRSASDSSEGIGDLLLRAKYVLHRGGPMDLATALGLSLPTGRQEDFQGTGTTLVQPTLIASRAVGQWAEVLANAGVDLDADDVDRSVVRWAAGGTVMLVDRLAAALVFLGRHELARQTDPIALPFFTQIERNDVVDASVGFRWWFAGTAVASLNALLPLNRDGLRADVIPTVQIEFAF